MRFVDGLIGTLGIFMDREVSININDNMYELSLQQWGAREVFVLDTDSIVHISKAINNIEYQRNGVDFVVMQEHGMVTMSLPAWAVTKLQYDIAHGNIQLPYITC
jgi:hypothetical protein